MAQIQSPETYADGQQVTAARLNNQTNGAILLPGAVTDQTAISGGVASGDSVMVHDLSASALRKATVGEVLGANVPVTTSAVTGGANSDIVLTPNDGAIVTGQAYTSGDGLTVTVTSTAHGLVVGQVILVTSAATGYNGTFRVATVATNSFTYVMTTAATPGSSTLSYTKKGSVRNAGSESVAGSLFVAGSAVISGDTALSGATTISGTTSVTGATNISGSLTSSGTANFTGTLQVGGSVGYMLYEVQEFSFSTQTSVGVGTTNVATSASFTKPSDEIWVFVSSIYVRHTGYNVTVAIRYSSQTINTGSYLALEGVQDAGSGSTSITRSLNSNWVIPLGTALTSQSLAIDVATSNGAIVFPTSGDGWSAISGNLPTSKISIYKYKTA